MKNLLILLICLLYPLIFIKCKNEVEVSKPAKSNTFEQKINIKYKYGVAILNGKAAYIDVDELIKTAISGMTITKNYANSLNLDMDILYI